MPVAPAVLLDGSVVVPDIHNRDSGGAITWQISADGTVILTGLPTADPLIAGHLYLAGNVLMVSTGFSGPVPDQVTGLAVAVISATELDLTWDTLSTAPDSYRVERSLTGTSGWAEVGSTVTASYADTGLTPAVTYYYRVRARDTNGNGAYSSVASGTTLAVPDQVTGLSVTTISATELDLTWDALSPGPFSYRVERSANGLTGWTEIGSSASVNYADTGLTASTAYYYRVKARNTVGDGAYSDVATGTTTFAPGGLAGNVYFQTADVGVYTDTARTTPATVDGDLVAGRTDQSGAGNHASATTTQRPALKLNIQNGKPALLYDGSGNYLNAGSDASLALTGDMTMWWVMKTNLMTGGTAGLFGRWNSNAGYLLWMDATALKISIQGNQNLVTWLGGYAAINDGLPHLIMGVRRAGTWYLYMDGRLKGAAAAVAMTSGAPFIIGSYGNGGGQKYHGYEFEGGVLNVGISDFNRGLLQDYYAAKYAITTMAPSGAAAQVYYGGIDSLAFVSSSGANGANTYLGSTLQERVRSRGLTVKELRLLIGNATGSTWKAKVFRPSGANYVFVSESEAFAPPATGLQIFTLATPMACQPGDILGVFVPTGGGALIKANASGEVRSAAGDISTTNAFSTTQAGSLDLEGLGDQPFVVGTGDSIMCGHNLGAGGQIWQTHYESGPAGDLTGSPLEPLYLANPSRYTYQNFGMGSQTFAWVAGTALPDIISAGLTPHALLIHAGVNDVGGGRTWAQIEANLDTIRALVTWDCEVFVDETLPRTAANDTQSAAIRANNASLATYCGLHAHWHVVACHDALGQTRPSTGQLDDLKTAYNMDGTHLLYVGTQALAAQQKAAMDAVFGP